MAELIASHISLGLLKEVYLLTRFVAQTARSASRHTAERNELLQALDFEHLYVQTFGLLFFRQQGVIVSASRLNERWFDKIGVILNGLRLVYADYAKLAGERDGVYQRSSPFFLAQSPDEQKSLTFEEFDAKTLELEKAGEKDTADVVVAIRPPEPPRTGPNKLKKGAFDWRWALWDKKSLEEILRKTQGWTGQLKEIMQLTMASNLSTVSTMAMSGVLTASRLAADPGADILGLKSHARLIELSGPQAATTPEIEAVNLIPVDLAAADYTLEAPEQQEGLALGRVRSTANRNDSKYGLVEWKKIDGVAGDSKEDNLKSIHALTELLAASSADVGTLPFRGYFQRAEAIGLVFDFPADAAEATPKTLLEVVSRSHTGTSLSLPYRFHVAQRIAKSLVALHADGWVHKSVRSRSVVFFQRLRDMSVDYGRPFLTNFEYTRQVESRTVFTSDRDPEKVRYRHPDRQGPPKASFNKIHDLYALGTVLLEIGLGKSLADVEGDMKAASGATNIDPDTFTASLVEIALRDLPLLMGPAYAEAVDVCLRGSFGVPMNDPDFSLVVLERVVEKLDSKHIQVVT